MPADPSVLPYLDSYHGRWQFIAIPLCSLQMYLVCFDQNYNFYDFLMLHILTQIHLLFSFCDCFVSKTLPNVHNLSIIGGAAHL